MNPESVDRLLAALSEVLGVRVGVIELPKLTPYKPEPEPPKPEPASAYVPRPKRMKAAPGTLESVKAVIVAAQKRGVHSKVLQKVVMDLGGKAKNPDTGVEGPSLKALPRAQYAACIAAVEALPATR